MKREKSREVLASLLFYGLGLLLKAGPVQLGVNAALGHQALVGALLADALFVQDENPVSALNGGQPMGDNQGGAVACQVLQGPLHHLLALGVQSAGGLVQNEDGRVLQKGPGNGKPLALASGQLYPPGADVRVVALGQLADKLLGPGPAGGGLHLLKGGAGLAVSDVLCHGAGEQGHVLLYQAHIPPQGPEGDGLNGRAVDGDLSGVHVVKPGD